MNKIHSSYQIISLFSIAITAMLFSCKSPGYYGQDGNYLAIDENILCVDDFNIDVTLKRNDGIPLNSHHGTSFRVFGDTLIENLKKDGWGWRVSMINSPLSFPMLRIGNGHNEFTSVPNVAYVSFSRGTAGLSCLARDFKNGNIFRFIVSENEDSMNINLVGQLPPNMFNAVCVSDSVAVCQVLESNVRQPRKMWRSGEFEEIPLLSNLNAASIKDNEDFNILSSGMAYNMNNGMIVEAPIMLNTLLLYDKDGNNGTTVCYGPTPMSIESVMDEDNPRRLYTFENPRAYDESAAVLWIGKTKFDFFNIGREGASVLFFDYNGNGKARYNFDFPITYFDYDESKNILYVRAEDNDEIYSFRI